MRKKNSVSDFVSHRNELIIKNFRESLARQSQISIRRAFLDAAEAPAPRFWVSEERATEVIAKMLAGEEVTKTMYKEKAEMYMEIYRRVKRLRELHPCVPLCRLVFRVVNSEAPRSYISWHRVLQIVRK